MDQVTFALVLGISGSLIATIIFIGCSQFIRKVLLPWHADLVYRGVRIDGRWTLVDPERASNVDEDEDEITPHNFESTGADSNPEVTLSLTQSADSVTGTLLVNFGKNRVEHKIRGVILNMYFVAIALPTSKRHTDPQSMLFHIDFYGGRLRMKGASCSVEKAPKINTFPNMHFELDKS